MTNIIALPWKEVLDSGKSHTIVGDVRIIDAFPIPPLQTERRVWIYLPRSYNDGGDRRYPVLYMQDGQSASMSFQVEHTTNPRGDRCLQRLISGPYRHDKR